MCFSLLISLLELSSGTSGIVEVEPAIAQLFVEFLVLGLKGRLDLLEAKYDILTWREKKTAALE